MSGSSSGGGGGGDDFVPCEMLKFDAQLTSPQPAVVQTIVAGDVLDVSIVALNGQQVLQALKNGQAAGGLIGTDASRLRACIIAGHAFRAVVLSVNGGQVRVHVEHA